MLQNRDWAAALLFPVRLALIAGLALLALLVDACNESGVALKMLAATKPMKQWHVAGERRRRIKAAFDAEGIALALPQRVVPMRENRKEAEV